MLQEIRSRIEEIIQWCVRVNKCYGVQGYGKPLRVKLHIKFRGVPLSFAGRNNRLSNILTDRKL